MSKRQPGREREGRPKIDREIERKAAQPVAGRGHHLSSIAAPGYTIAIA
jgi:hypothetical protein